MEKLTPYLKPIKEQKQSDRGYNGHQLTQTFQYRKNVIHVCGMTLAMDASGVVAADKTK